MEPLTNHHKNIFCQTMHFEKGLVDSSKKDIVDGHSTVAAFAHLIEESDE